jgi:membrane protein DedA with SNARE-associated domain
VVHHVAHAVSSSSGELWQTAALFFGTFVNESAALAGGALLIAEQRMATIYVAIVLFFAIVTSDVCIYGIGVLARRNEWTRRRLLRNKAAIQSSAWLESHLTLAVVMARLVPGVLCPTFLACGGFGISFKRFVLTTLSISAVYTPVALYALTHLGIAALPKVSAAPLFAGLAVLLVVTAVVARAVHVHGSAMTGSHFFGGDRVAARATDSMAIAATAAP